MISWGSQAADFTTLDLAWLSLMRKRLVQGQFGEKFVYESTVDCPGTATL